MRNVLSSLKHHIPAASMLIAGVSLAQYIPNQNFEVFTSCPTGNSQINFATPWVDANSASCDYHNTCGYVGNGVIDGGPSNGNGSLGCWAYPAFASCPGSAYAETIRGTLLQPLVANQSYCITWDIRVDGTGSITNGPNNCMDYGFYFFNSATPPVVNGTCSFSVAPQVFINGSVILQGTYQTFTGTYVAAGGENTVIIGPFNNANTATCGAGTNTYLNVDNITMVLCSSCTPPTLATNFVAALCNTGCTGTATVTPSGGSPPYTYAWSNSQVTQTATGLCAGTYTVTVTENGGCSTTTTITVTAPPALTLSAAPTAIQCNGGTGSITATAGGGVGPYTYAWSPSAQTTQTATGLGAGTYIVTITDANGCTMTASATLTNPPAITASSVSTPTTCGASNGTATVTASGGTGTLTYVWAPSGGNAATANGLAAGTYTVTITDANGCTQTSTVTVTTSNGPVTTLASQVNPLCATSTNGTATVTVVGGTAPYTYAWSPTGGNAATGTGLGAGTYTVIVTDVNNCSSTSTVTITSPPALTLTTTSTVAQCNASDGTATASAGGGTGALTYLWSAGSQTAATATGLSAGTYTVTITDANGCTMTNTVVVNMAGGPTAVATGNATITYGNSTPITSGGGVSYLWSPSTGLSCTTCQNPTATPVVTTTYCVVVTDASGCTDSACVEIIVDVPCPTNPDFGVPNAFSPNKDGHNDIFILQGMGLCMTDFLMVIYDRWGEKIFEATSPNIGWDGSYKGKVMDPGVFVYHITATFTGNKESFVKKGNITLIR